MTDTKHNHPETSTCTACREWKRDMDGTVATLERERAISKQLLESLSDVIRICDAIRYTAGLGRNQLERIQKARAAIAKATGRAA